MSLAIAYVPWQHWNETYQLDKAMQVGTIFPELDKPFLGKRGACR
ncbi:MAG: spore coat associated protein CotJA [Lachnospiraceae bacterium]|nr:spore coat associated protein CotJA [Lachnospiraceae bacterium]MCI9018548.1 spore coat associated protein CotJA [Lachnospiraceae bacterium]MCI9305655.1 spore coat associated protein CotJA [Lachnospiraceae bacterium]MCI9681832.1 spore coat associated protein CotJA [Lachnospiraceae bacterium]